VKVFIDNFVPSIDEAELKDGTMKLVNVAGKDVLLARIGDQVFVFQMYVHAEDVTFQRED
jgi:hypothetical protein